MTYTPQPDDVCPRPDRLPPQPTDPLAPAIHLSAVYRCDSPQQADQLLSGELSGYVYSRDGHPNGDQLAEKLRLLHGAEQAAIASTGMGALGVAALAFLEEGDHVVVSNRLYGRSSLLLGRELPRLGIGCTAVDTSHADETAEAFTSRTKWLVVETITNPLLRVSDLQLLARLAHENGARLLVDNTFAGPIVCRPIEWGADLVWESLTKIINGHSDVNLGLLCGPTDGWSRVPEVLKTWGLASNPFDCWLAHRGLGTLALRSERASANALAVAGFLETRLGVDAVEYPGLPSHRDHRVARRLFGGRFGSMVTFTLPGGTAAAEKFISAAPRIPFSPSLGDLSTTLSHPESTSHRGLSAADRAALGIEGGTIRLSVGIETPDAIFAALSEGLLALSAPPAEEL
ncbi:MAG: PLP-dependent aspartate aminotransferase family protein [Pirellulales bacterium]